MTDLEPDPVTDWATDFDHTHPQYAADTHTIWDDLRQRCPVAHSDRFGGVWLPTRHADVRAIADDVTHFSSVGVIVTGLRPDMPPPVGYAPPITSDPPFHADARKLLLPAFAPRVIERLEPTTREACRQLLDELLADDPTVVDAALDYAQHIPVMVIAHMLGVPLADGDRFRLFIHRILETPGQNEDIDPDDTLEAYLDEAIADHRAQPRDDLMSFLINAELEGEPLTDDHIRGTCGLLLLAGIDTTWSAIGASLWHLAGHEDDRRRLTAEPDLMPLAIEEFLRAYAPVTMARLVIEDTELDGCPIKEGDWMLLPFPAANRDPDFFEQADEVVIDRARNRHSAFGLGIHRCVGSNLARMELTVAIEEWLARVPEFELADANAVQWSTGQIRGPRTLPLRLPGAAS